MTQQTMKLAKNAPCHCGSGRKYKRCCWAKDMAAQSGQNQPVGIKPQPKLKNTFRKEIHAKNVSDAELMYRDQVVLLMELEGEVNRRVADAAHYKAALDDRKAEKVAYQNLSASEGRTAALEGVKKNIEFLTGKFEEMDSPLPRVQECQLDALRRVVRMGIGGHEMANVVLGVAVGKTMPPVPVPVVVPESAEGSVPITEPVDEKPTEKITQTKPMEHDGPIQVDGGGGDDSDDEDDEDESLAAPKETESAIVTP